MRYPFQTATTLLMLAGAGHSTPAAEVAVDQFPAGHQIRYRSGDSVYVEDLIGGRLVGRSWSGAGEADAAGSRPGEAFRIQIMRETGRGGTGSVSFEVDPLGMSGGSQRPLLKTIETEVTGGELAIFFQGMPGAEGELANFRGKAAKVGTPEINGLELVQEAAGKDGFSLRVHCGSEQDWEDSHGQIWKADRDFSEGNWGAVGGEMITRIGLRIESPGLGPIYSSQRYGVGAYRITCPNGKYKLTLHFCETYQPITKAGQRVFTVTVDANKKREWLAGGWEWSGGRDLPGEENGKKHFVVELINPGHRIGLRVHTLLDGTPILTRWLEVENKSSVPFALTELSPWCGRLWPRNAPVTLGHAIRDQYEYEGWFGWTRLLPGKNKFTAEKGESRAKPFFLLRNEDNGQYFIGGLAWPANYAMSFDQDQGTNFEIGPTTYYALRVLAPGETVATPAVHLGWIRRDFDAAVQAMHAHIRRSVRPKMDPARSYRSQYIFPEDLPQSVYHGKDFNEANMIKAIDVAGAAGIEMFTIDGPMWCSGYGNWLVADRQRFPHGLAPLVAHAHSKGMLFGGYFETEGGRDSDTMGSSHCVIAPWQDSRVYQQHPDWFTPGKGPVLNLSIKGAAAYFETEVNKIVEYYRLDLYRHDFNGLSRNQGPQTNRFGFIESDYWRHYSALYRAFDHVRELHPEVLLQQAAGGGGRDDLGDIGHVDEQQTTDRGGFPGLYLASSGLSVFLPPEILQSPNGMAWLMGSTTDTDTTLRGAYAMGQVPVIFDAVLPKSVDEFEPGMREKYQHYAQIYKNFIRPLLATCKIYHHAPVNATGGVEANDWSARGVVTPKRENAWDWSRDKSNDWFAMEFTSPDKQKGWALVISLDEREEGAYQLKLKGVDGRQSYRVTSDNAGTTQVLGGAGLMSAGLSFKPAKGNRSELYLFQAAPP